MKLRMIRLGLLLVGNAIGLWIASLILDDDMRLSGLAFVLAVAIFTVFVAVLEPLVAKAAERWADFLGGASALIATGLALILTSVLSDGLSIDGIGTWVLATLIVWAAAAIIGLVLVRAFAKKSRRSATPRSEPTPQAPDVEIRPVRQRGYARHRARTRSAEGLDGCTLAVRSRDGRRQCARSRTADRRDPQPRLRAPGHARRALGGAGSGDHRGAERAPVRHLPPGRRHRRNRRCRRARPTRPVRQSRRRC